ncbi:MAG: chitobiase/beta-hexosaminidase C-terminal domain-containing protein [Desulfuromonadales bacterium]
MMIQRSIYVSVVLCLCVLLCGVESAFSGVPDTVATVAGIGTLGPAAVATDSLGNYYVADTGHNKVILVTVIAGVTTTTTVGTGIAGFVPFTDTTTIADASIQFNAPAGIATDSNGNVYIADTGNHRIHMIAADPVTKVVGAASRIVTIAGNGVGGFSGDGLTATGASLNSPTGVAVDATGIIYIADNGNYRIRKELAIKSVKNTTTGITTYTPGVISTISGDGTATNLTAYGVVLSPAPAGDLYIADSGNNRILKLTAAKGTPSIVAGNGTSGFSGDGGLAIFAQLNNPSGVTTDGKDLYIADTMNSCVRKVSLATGVISTRLGSVAAQAAAIAAPAGFGRPVSVAIDSAGTVYVEDTGNSVIQRIYASVSSITTASPPGGKYATTQNVTLTSSKAAKIYYTTTGATPAIPVFPAAPVAPTILYSAPIQIASTTTLKFASSDVAGNSEVINTATYTISTTAPVTTAAINATPVNGVYYSALSALAVTLTSNDPTASIYYTTTGTAPTTASTKYSFPIPISVPSTLTTTNVQFFAADVAGNKEVAQSQKYQVVALTTSASPVGGVYPGAKNVTLASNSPTAPIYYTTDGSDPSLPAGAGPLGTMLYAAPVSIAASTTLKYRAKDANNNLEQIKAQTYTIDTIPPTTTAAPPGGSFSLPQTVTLTSNELNATIYYTTTGIAPTTSSTKYTAPLTISKTTTLMYFAVDLAGNRGVVGTQVYIIDSIAPITTASVQSGTYSSIQSVTLTSDDPKATIYFTTDGSTPTTLSTKYTAPILINNTTTLQYFAMDLVGNKEVVKKQEYTIITLTTTASPKGGVYNAPQSVVLATNGTGATIYYTVDGTVPAITSKTTQKYSSPILMSANKTTVQFFAVDGSGVTENVKAEMYTVDSAAPVTTATCGTAANTIALAADDPLAKIKYRANSITKFTQNGAVVTVPAYTLTDYTSQLTFANNTIVKFFAVDAAGNTELIETAYCPEVVATAPAVVVDPNPALYIDTLPHGASTSNTSLYIIGNVAPFAVTTTLDINGVAVTTSATDGSFSYVFNPLAVGPNIITATPAISAVPTTAPDTRTITYNAALASPARPNSLTIGKSNGVIGKSVRVPITLTSGYQSAAVSIDIAYDPATSRLSNPGVRIAEGAAALGKSIQGGSPAAGVYRILIMDSNSPATLLKPLPDGVIAYLSFSIAPSSSTGIEALHINAWSATDLDAVSMTVNTGTDGLVNVVSKPGNSIGLLAGDVPVTLKGVQDALYMLLDPVTNQADGSVDLNADGIVQIYELQQVINSFLGL